MLAIWPGQVKVLSGLWEQILGLGQRGTFEHGVGFSL